MAILLLPVHGSFETLPAETMPRSIKPACFVAVYVQTGCKDAEQIIPSCVFSNILNLQAEKWMMPVPDDQWSRPSDPAC